MDSAVADQPQEDGADDRDIVAELAPHDVGYLTQDLGRDQTTAGQKLQCSALFGFVLAQTVEDDVGVDEATGHWLRPD